MRHACYLLVALLIASHPAQADGPKPPVSPVQAKLDAARRVLDQGQGERAKEYERINAEPGSTEAKEPRYLAAAERYHAAITSPIDDLLAAAKEHPADPSTIAALRLVTIEARGLSTNEVDQAIALLGDHVREAGITEATGPLWLHHEKPAAVAVIRAVMADNPNREERGRACHDLAFLLKFRVDQAARVQQRHTGEPLDERWKGADLDAIRAEAATLLDRCLAEFADVPIGPLSPGKTIGDYAVGELNEIRHLQIGQVAPEIDGKDVAGQPLRLSDYRGKWVVLIFSGEWCGPCRGTAPFLRTLLQPESQAKTACVVLEVNTDSTRDPIQKAIDAGDVAWPCWFDGGTDGPITRNWAVSAFPALYILDPRGVIRAKDFPGPAVIENVARLVAAPLETSPL